MLDVLQAAAHHRAGQARQQMVLALQARSGRLLDLRDARPPTCKGYACGWLMSNNVSDEWYPLHSRMVLSLGVHDGINCVTVTVDPGSPNIWKQAPYYGQLKNMVRAGLAAKTPEEIQFVHVRCDGRVWLMTMDDDIDITFHTYIVKLIRWPLQRRAVCHPGAGAEARR